MGLSYKVNELPTTLREGEFAVVDGVVYVGNSANEPVPIEGGGSTPVVTELPVTLEKGKQLLYDVGTCLVRYIGNENNVPRPSKGYREILMRINNLADNIIGTTIIKDEFGGATLSQATPLGVALDGLSVGDYGLFGDQTMGILENGNDNLICSVVYDRNLKAFYATQDGIPVNFSAFYSGYLSIKGDFDI